jgi:hypothetical protein
MTMAQFAELLPPRPGAYIRSDLRDAAGLDGSP